jgi:hypothetical protein
MAEAGWCGEVEVEATAILTEVERLINEVRVVLERGDGE